MLINPPLLSVYFFCHSLEMNMMKPLPFTQQSFVPSHAMFLSKHLDSMSIMSIITVALLVAILVIRFIVEQQKHSEEKDIEIQECELIKIHNTRKDSTRTEPGLEQVESSYASGILDSTLEKKHELPSKEKELVLEAKAEHQIAIDLSRLSFQIVALQTPPDSEAQPENLKVGLPIACLVISVSTTGIVSFLVGYSGSQSSIRNELLFKAVIVSMSASLFSALLLLILSTNHYKHFSCLSVIVKITIWISTALMSVGVVLVIVFYFHVA